MAKGKIKSRAAARKIKDKWKAKEWYKITTPDFFNNTQIAETPADDPDKLIGRVTEVTLQDITGDFSKMHIKLRFKINNVSGLEAGTKFIGHDLTSDYVRRQTRRRRSKMDGIYDVFTKDGYKMRIKPMAIAEKRIQTSQQKLLRALIYDAISENSQAKLFPDFVKMMLDGTLSADIAKRCKKVYPMRRIEIRKSQVLVEPSAEQISKAKELEEKALEKAAKEEEEKPKKAKKVAKAPKGDEVKHLTALPGVGAAKAQVLFDAGYTSVSQVLETPEEKLAEVVGDKLAKKILTPPE